MAAFCEPLVTIEISVKAASYHVFILLKMFISKAIYTKKGDESISVSGLR